MLNLVNKIETESFGLESSNLVHRVLITFRGQHLFIYKVKGQGQTLDIVVKPCKQNKDRILWVTIKLSTDISYDKMMTPIDFQSQGTKVKVICLTLLLACRDECQESYCCSPGVGLGVGPQKLQPCLLLMNYSTCAFLMTRAFHGYQSFYAPSLKGPLVFDLVTLTLKFDLLLKNFNLGHSFLTRRVRLFILHMYIPCDKTFPWVPTFLTLWPWPWRLTYF